MSVGRRPTNRGDIWYIDVVTPSKSAYSSALEQPDTALVLASMVIVVTVSVSQMESGVATPAARTEQLRLQPSRGAFSPPGVMPQACPRSTHSVSRLFGSTQSASENAGTGTVAIIVRRRVWPGPRNGITSPGGMGVALSRSSTTKLVTPTQPLLVTSYTKVAVGHVYVSDTTVMD